MNPTTVPSVTLNNNVSMPQFGLGVWQATDGEEVEAAVTAALQAGYRLIDTAAVYGNEKGVGRAIAASSIPRQELFVTTKLWNADQGYSETLTAFETSRRNLGLEYIDLYLIHWPAPAADKYVESWKALEQLYKDKQVRAIGVSNFKPSHIEKLLLSADIIPAVNQIELHPQFTQAETRQICATHGIAVEAYSPLGSGKSNLLTSSVLLDIGRKYGKTSAQVVLRWHIQNGLIVIPKSVHEDRIKENIAIFDFSLDEQDMALITTLDSGERIGADPDTANFM